MGRSPETAVIIHADKGSLRTAFENLPHVKTDLPAGEPAFWTLPRKKGAWRLPANTGSRSKLRRRYRESDEIVSLPMRDEIHAHSNYTFIGELNFETAGDISERKIIFEEKSPIKNAYLNQIPQPMIMHKKVAKVIEERALATLPYFAHENSLARREYDVPMLLMRADVVVDKAGNIQMCEVDDVPSLWSWSSEYNPIVESHINALEDQMGLPIFLAELFEGDEIMNANVQLENWFQMPDGNWELVSREGQKKYQKLQHSYFHCDDHWGGTYHINWETGHVYTPDEIALIIRARKHAQYFDEFMNDRGFGSRSITMAWERDSRRPLAAANLGILAANLDVALEFGEEYLKEDENTEERLVYKADGARTELTAIHTVKTGKHAKRPGESSTSQIRKKFEKNGYDDGPILIQRFKKPPTLEEAGVIFQEGDREYIKNQEGVREDAGELIVPGNESDFSMIFRTFVVYLPKGRDGNSKKGEFVHIGGLWQASPGYIVHGGSHSVAGPLYVDGLMGMQGPGTQYNKSLKLAEKMVRDNSLEKSGLKTLPWMKKITQLFP